jgi:hypothetical protein
MPFLLQTGKDMSSAEPDSRSYRSRRLQNERPSPKAREDSVTQLNTFGALEDEMARLSPSEVLRPSSRVFLRVVELRVLDCSDPVSKWTLSGISTDIFVLAQNTPEVRQFCELTASRIGQECPV